MADQGLSMALRCRSKSRGHKLSLWPIGCTIAVCDVQCRCICSCHLWHYKSVMPLPLPITYSWQHLLTYSWSRMTHYLGWKDLYVRWNDLYVGRCTALWQDGWCILTLVPEIPGQQQELSREIINKKILRMKISHSCCKNGRFYSHPV